MLEFSVKTKHGISTNTAHHNRELYPSRITAWTLTGSLQRHSGWKIQVIKYSSRVTGIQVERYQLHYAWTYLCSRNYMSYLNMTEREMDWSKLLCSLSFPCRSFWEVGPEHKDQTKKINGATRYRRQTGLRGLRRSLFLASWAAGRGHSTPLAVARGKQHSWIGRVQERLRCFVGVHGFKRLDSSSPKTEFKMYFKHL